MRFKFGTFVCVELSCTTAGLRRSNFLTFAAGCYITNVIPCVVCMVVRWCVLSAVWTIVGAVGFVVVVTDGAGPTLSHCGTPSEVGGLSEVAR